MSHAAKKRPKRGRTKKTPRAQLSLRGLGSLRMCALAVAAYIALAVLYAAVAAVLPLRPPATGFTPASLQALPFGLFRLDALSNGGVSADLSGGYAARALSPVYPLGLALLRAVQVAPFLYLGWVFGGKPSPREATQTLRLSAYLLLGAWALSLAAALLEYNYLVRAIRFEGLHMRVHFLAYAIGPVLCALLRGAAAAWERHMAEAREEQNALRRELAEAHVTSVGFPAPPEDAADEPTDGSVSDG